MFDIAFSELVVIAIVALLVIGPDKLPKIARTAGHLFGRAQRYVNDVKSDINRELRFEELQNLQDEIRQNAQQAQNTQQPQYKAGQIIRHDMEQTAPKYQAGQIIRHDLEQSDPSADEPQRPTMMADYIDPAPLKQGAVN